MIHFYNYQNVIHLNFTPIFILKCILLIMFELQIAFLCNVITFSRKHMLLTGFTMFQYCYVHSLFSTVVTNSVTILVNILSMAAYSTIYLLSMAAYSNNEMTVYFAKN